MGLQKYFVSNKLFLNANQADYSVMKIANLGELPPQIKRDTMTAATSGLAHGVHFLQMYNSGLFSAAREGTRERLPFTGGQLTEQHSGKSTDQREPSTPRTAELLYHNPAAV